MGRAYYCRYIYIYIYIYTDMDGIHRETVCERNREFFAERRVSLYIYIRRIGFLYVPIL